MTVNNELEEMLKEVVMTKFRVLSQLLFERVKRSMTYLRLGNQCLRNAETPVMWKPHTGKGIHVLSEKNNILHGRSEEHTSELQSPS
jgi:hypothetical protein